jgi:hypothetical protein
MSCQITVTVPDAVYNLLKTISADQGQSASNVAASALESGLYDKVENLLKVERYLGTVEERGKSANSNSIQTS